MTPFELISFDEAGFKMIGDEGNRRYWESAGGDGISLFYFGIPPDIPVPLSEIDALRGWYRNNIAASGKAMIENEVVTIDGVASIRQIIKIPQQPSGITYLGSFTIPFRDRSFVLKVQCEERGMTGMREAVVMDSLFGDGTVTIDDGKLVGWQADPYDPGVQLPLMRNRAEDPAFDAQFPDHPLSRVRKAFAQIEGSLRLHDLLKAQPSFAGPIVREAEAVVPGGNLGAQAPGWKMTPEPPAEAAPPKKPWWKRG